MMRKPKRFRNRSKQATAYVPSTKRKELEMKRKPEIVDDDPINEINGIEIETEVDDFVPEAEETLLEINAEVEMFERIESKARKAKKAATKAKVAKPTRTKKAEPKVSKRKAYIGNTAATKKVQTVKRAFAKGRRVLAKAGRVSSNKAREMLDELMDEIGKRVTPERKYPKPAIKPKGRFDIQGGKIEPIITRVPVYKDVGEPEINYPTMNGIDNLTRRLNMNENRIQV